MTGTADRAGGAARRLGASRAGRRLGAAALALALTAVLAACGEKEEPDLSTVPAETVTTPTAPAPGAPTPTTPPPTPQGGTGATAP